MDEMWYVAMVQRMEALEARIVELERLMEEPQTLGGVTARLHRKYPIAMTKSDAANELCVTRATVYAMLSDGRLEENGRGKVLTQSVIDLMTKSAHPGRKTRGKRKAADGEGA